MISLETITINDIPKEGDLIRGKELNKPNGTNLYEWILCPDCSNGRWRSRGSTKKKSRCVPCYHLQRHPCNKYKTITNQDIPCVGDLIRGGEIGKAGYKLYAWTICPDCGIERWVEKQWSMRGRICKKCAGKRKSSIYIGEKSSQWKGGRRIERQGYIRVIVRKDELCYPMIDRNGYVAEHRLVMSQHLGRCLESWEIVHHINGVRGDNRIENLELIESKNAHNTITVIQREVKKLRNQVKLNEWRIKELEAILKKEQIEYY